MACTSPSSCLAANSHPLASSPDSLNSFRMNTYRNRISNPFRMNAQHPTSDADPERPSGAEGFLPYSGPTLTTVESILTESSRRNPFRMNTYEKTGGRGWYPHSTFLTVALLLFPSLFCRARQLIFLFLNGLRTLYPKHPGVPRFFFTPGAFPE